MSEDKKVILDYKEHERLLRLEETIKKEFEEFKKSDDLIIIRGVDAVKITHREYPTYTNPFIIVKNSEEINHITERIKEKQLKEETTLDELIMKVKYLRIDNEKLSNNNKELQKENEKLNYHIKSLENKLPWWKRIFK